MKSDLNCAKQSNPPSRIKKKNSQFNKSLSALAHTDLCTFLCTPGSLQETKQKCEARVRSAWCGCVWKGDGHLSLPFNHKKKELCKLRRDEATAFLLKWSPGWRPSTTAVREKRSIHGSGPTWLRRAVKVSDERTGSSDYRRVCAAAADLGGSPYSPNPRGTYTKNTSANDEVKNKSCSHAGP